MLTRCKVIVVVLAGSFVAATTPASAGIWAWGCIGKLGNERVIFNRDTMIVTASKLPRVKLQDLANNGPRLETDDGATFDNLSSNGGFEKTIRFEKNGDPEQKLTLTETSSRRTYLREGHVGRREETTAKFLKTFRYALDKEPARTIKMQCIEYVLTTCGGPCS